VSCACELILLLSVSLELCINLTSGLLETEHQTIGELWVAIDAAMRVSLQAYPGDKVTAHAVKVRSVLVSEWQYLAVQLGVLMQSMATCLCKERHRHIDCFIRCGVKPQDHAKFMCLVSRQLYTVHCHSAQVRVSAAAPRKNWSGRYKYGTGRGLFWWQETVWRERHGDDWGKPFQEWGWPNTSVW